MTAYTLPLFTWLLVLALFPHINLFYMLQKHKLGIHSHWEWKTMRNVLAIHSGDNLTADLLLIQCSQHSITAVSSPHQIYHKHLRAQKMQNLKHMLRRLCVFVCLCV